MARRGSRSDVPRLPVRRPDTHKGDYGRVLIVAGSAGMMGAAILASEAAYRAAAGLVRIACPASLVAIASVKQTCAIVDAMPDTGQGALGTGARERILEVAASCDAIAIGPGLGRHPQTVEEVRQIVTSVQRPLVLDADALNAFADHPELLGRGAAARVLTPHPGEMSRLMGMSGADVQADRTRIAREAAARFLGVVVLKGHRTVVTDGTRVYLNRTGNPGMATGGAGDVLTGVIAGLVAQRLTPYDAARLGVFVHGLAGDLAARQVGTISLMATDVLDALAPAFKRHHGE
jgi:ADP-dependent NAD(P)H-hydrate dehydratase / NAD(P)H-hydrate epimerase